MNVLGYFTVFLCAVFVVCGQNSTVSDKSPVTETTPVLETTTGAPPATTTSAPPATTTGAPPATTTSAPPATTSSAPPATTTSAPPATTTSAPPATTTSEPPATTTSQPPATTTSAPPATTTSEPPATTTSAPLETTTAEPTGSSGTATTPSGESTTTAAPSPDVKLYVNNSGIFCMLVNMEMTLNIEYVNGTGVNVTNKYVVNNEDLMVDETKSSNCSESSDEEHLVATIKGNNELFMQFNKADKKSSLNLLRFTFSDLQNIFPDAMKVTNMTLESKSKLFESSSSKSYKCDAETKVDLVDESGSKTNSFVSFKDVRVQAFREDTNANFADAEDCVQDDNVSDIVPIAVGCALAALVVIVLIAYLVGRRQKRQRGYESV